MTCLLTAGSLLNTGPWPQVAELGLGLLMSAVIGLERKAGQKSAEPTFRPSRRGTRPDHRSVRLVDRLTSGTLDAVSD